MSNPPQVQSKSLSIDNQQRLIARNIAYAREQVQQNGVRSSIQSNLDAAKEPVKLQANDDVANETTINVCATAKTQVVCIRRNVRSEALRELCTALPDADALPPS